MRQDFESCLSPEAAAIELSPAQRLLDHNLAHLFRQAAKSTEFCEYCGWPLDTYMGPQGGSPFTSCIVCCDMNTIMLRKPYWTGLEKAEKARRKEMGLDS